MGGAMERFAAVVFVGALWAGQHQFFQRYEREADEKYLMHTVGTTGEGAPYTPAQKLIFCSREGATPTEKGVLRVQDGRVEYRFRIRKDNKGPDGASRSVFYFMSSACDPNTPTNVDVIQQRVFLNRNTHYERNLSPERFGGQDALNARLDDVIREAMGK